MSDFKMNILGVRGSKPVCDSRFLRYGGNTFCVELLIKDLCMVFDAGTGIDRLKKDRDMNELNLFFTHYHIDHIMGIYYLEHLYCKEKTVNFYGFSGSGDLRSELDFIFSSTVFPLSFDELAAKKNIKTLQFGQSLNLDYDIKIDTFELVHPGGCMAYSVRYGGKKICICTDTAPMSGEKLKSFYKFVDNSDYIVFDAYFMPGKVIEAWGHSSYMEAVDVLRHCNVGRMLLTHFSEMDDGELDELQAKLKTVDDRLTLCREGMCIEL